LDSTASSDDFASLGLSAPLLAALKRAGHARPSPIQQAAIPALLAGRDLIATAQTGSGKTAAYTLPILHELAQMPAAAPDQPDVRPIRALVLVPTRELASQVAATFRIFGRDLSLRTRIIAGGMKRAAQLASVLDGCDIAVATCGRLLDLLDSGELQLDALRILVLDEADQMLDQDSLQAMASISAYLPARRQTILCSATMPDAVLQIARRLMHDPLPVDAGPETTTPKKIAQGAIFLDPDDKPRAALAILRETAGRALVFVRTRAQAERVCKALRSAGIGAESLHGDRTQGARNRALDAFRKGAAPVLVATDIAARGLDVEDVALVLNCDMPDTPETYVHRIGRTARAGKRGRAITLCGLEERAALREIEKHIGLKLKILPLPV
jgi:ATP-dependent RNA helicase RhlE